GRAGVLIGPSKSPSGRYGEVLAGRTGGVRERSQPVMSMLSVSRQHVNGTGEAGVRRRGSGGAPVAGGTRGSVGPEVRFGRGMCTIAEAPVRRALGPWRSW